MSDSNTVLESLISDIEEHLRLARNHISDTIGNICSISDAIVPVNWRILDIIVELESIYDRVSRLHRDVYAKIYERKSQDVR